MSANIEAIHNPLRGSGKGSWGASELVDHLLADGEIDLDPDYQRAHVWTQEQQMAYIGHMLEGGTSPEVWMLELPYVEGGPQYECVDGKQRIHAIRLWWIHAIPARLSPENDHRLIWRRELSRAEELRVKRDQLRTNVVFLDETTTRSQVLRFYLRLNSGGTQHSRGEIERVRDLLKEETSV